MSYPSYQHLQGSRQGFKGRSSISACSFLIWSYRVGASSISLVQVYQQWDLDNVQDYQISSQVYSIMFEYGQTHLYKSTNHDQKIHGAPINKSSKYCFSAVRRSRSTRTSSSSCCAATWPSQPLQFGNLKRLENRCPSCVYFHVLHLSSTNQHWKTEQHIEGNDTLICNVFFDVLPVPIATDDNQPNPGVKQPELQEESLWTEHSELLSSPFTDWMCHQDYQTSGLCNLTKCCPVLECKRIVPNSVQESWQFRFEIREDSSNLIISCFSTCNIQSYHCMISTYTNHKQCCLLFEWTSSTVQVHQLDSTVVLPSEVCPPQDSFAASAAPSNEPRAILQADYADLICMLWVEGTQSSS